MCHGCSWRKVDLDPGGFPAPCERMCHSLTCLADGRLLLLGGRTKEGLCRDVWTLAMVSALCVWFEDHVCGECCVVWFVGYVFV